MVGRRNDCSSDEVQSYATPQELAAHSEMAVNALAAQGSPADAAEMGALWADVCNYGTTHTDDATESNRSCTALACSQPPIVLGA